MALRITRAAQDGRIAEASAESTRLKPLWELFAEFGGSLRVVAAMAEHLGFAAPQSLPLPLQGLTDTQHTRVALVAKQLQLA